MSRKSSDLENALCIDFPLFTGPYSPGYNSDRAFHPDLDRDKIVPLYTHIAEVVSETIQSFEPTPTRILVRMSRRDYDHVKYLDSIANVGFGGGLSYVMNYLNEKLADTPYTCCSCGDLDPRERPSLPGMNHVLDLRFKKKSASKKREKIKRK